MSASPLTAAPAIAASNTGKLVATGELSDPAGAPVVGSDAVAADIAVRQDVVRQDREELDVRAGQFARGARAELTWRAYAGQWRRFEAWCQGLGERSLPATPGTVARFVTDLAPVWRPVTPGDTSGEVIEGYVLVRAGLRPSSITGYVAAISVAHQSAGVANPTRHDSVRLVLAGIRRHPGVATARRRSALSPVDMATILATLNPTQVLADARDAAMLLIGWKAALRTDDLHRLRLGDVVLNDDGLSVHLRRSKTDQTGKGEIIGITAIDLEDPLDAVTAWVRWRNRLAAHVFHSGPAWRPIDRYGARSRPTAMSTKAISTMITRRAAAAQLDGDYGGHSLRRGFATSALAGGASERAVQRHGRWAGLPSIHGPLHRRGGTLRRHQPHPTPRCALRQGTWIRHCGQEAGEQPRLTTARGRTMSASVHQG